MRLKIFIFYFLLLAALTGFSQYSGTGMGANAMARMATVESLVARGTPVIDRSSLARTPDRVRICGRYYGGQLPLLQYAVAPLYCLLHKVFGLSFSSDARLVYALMTVLTVGLLSSLMLSLFCGMMARFGLGSSKALFAAAVLGLGTLVLPYSIVFNAHLVAGALVFFALYILFRGPGRFGALPMGLLTGAAAVIDPAPGVAFSAALLLLFACSAGRRRWVLPFCGGIIVPVAFHCFISLRSVGTVLPVNLFPEHYAYPCSIFDGTSLSGVASHGSLRALLLYSYHSLAGMRGLFSYNPVLLFPSAALITCAFSRRIGGRYRSRSITILCASAAVVAVYLVKSVNYGGWSYGMRFFVPVVPAVAIYLGPFLARRRHAAVRALFILALAVSVAVSLVGATNPWSDLYIGPNPVVNNVIMVFGNLAVRPPSCVTRLAMRINEGDGTSLYYLGSKFCLYGWKDCAAEAFAGAVRADPACPAARLSLASAYYDIGDRAGALDEYNAFLAADPEYIIAACEYDIGRGTTVIRVAGEDVAARKKMALLLAAGGRSGEAAELVRDYLDKGGDRLLERFRGEGVEGEMEVVYPRSRAGLELLLKRLEE